MIIRVGRLATAVCIFIHGSTYHLSRFVYLLDAELLSHPPERWYM